MRFFYLNGRGGSDQIFLGIISAPMFTRQISLHIFLLGVYNFTKIIALCFGGCFDHAQKLLLTGGNSLAVIKLLLQKNSLSMNPTPSLRSVIQSFLCCYKGEWALIFPHHIDIDNQKVMNVYLCSIYAQLYIPLCTQESVFRQCSNGCLLLLSLRFLFFNLFQFSSSFLFCSYP